MDNETTVAERADTALRVVRDNIVPDSHRYGAVTGADTSGTVSVWRHRDHVNLVTIEPEAGKGGTALTLDGSGTAELAVMLAFASRDAVKWQQENT